MSSLGSSTRAIGVYEQRWASAPSGPLCVYLHGVGDPGNVGTVLRGALAFGASSVALGPGCADPYGPKAVRASMGAIFAVELARVEDLRELPGERVALVAGSGEPLYVLSAKLARSAITLLVGSEREGLPEELVSACEHVAHIPIEEESLNAAMAASVALYEMTRGWRLGSGIVIERTPQPGWRQLRPRPLEELSGGRRGRRSPLRAKRASGAAGVAISGARPSCPSCCAASPSSSPPSAGGSARPPTRHGGRWRR